jgi:hypothetical protein
MIGNSYPKMDENCTRARRRTLRVKGMLLQAFVAASALFSLTLAAETEIVQNTITSTKGNTVAEGL